MRSLEYLPDPLAVARHVADRAVGAVLGLPHRLAVGRGEDVLFLDHDAARLGELVDPIHFHVTAPRCTPNHEETSANRAKEKMASTDDTLGMAGVPSAQAWRRDCAV